MANKETVRVKKKERSGKMSVAIEYVGVIAIVCLFAGAMIGWSIAPRATGGDPHDHGNVSMNPAGDDAAIQAALERIEHETDFGALVEIGNHGYEKGRPDVAIPAYEKALTVKPDDPNVLSDLGAMYISIGRADKAIELNKKAIAHDPSHIKSRYNLGVAYVNAGDKANARKTFEEVIKLQPSSPEASDAQARLKELAK